MGETNSSSVAHVGYDISPLKRAKLKITTTSRQENLYISTSPKVINSILL
jgi:hypothetical protein